MKKRKRQIEKAKKKQKEAKRAQIHRILDLAIDRNAGGETTFFEFVGHVNEITIRLHEGKWTYDQPVAKITLIHHLGGDYGDSLEALEAALCGR